MQYFKNTDGGVYAYDDDVAPEFFAVGLTPITEAEAMSLLNPPPTPEQVVIYNEGERTRLRAIADSEIEWRQDAVDVGIATTEETTALSDWKKYRVLLMRVDTAAPVWPQPPED